MSIPRRALGLLVALALAAAGCGGSSPSTTTGTAPATPPIASAPDATQPPPDATQPGTGPVTTTGRTTRGSTTQRSTTHGATGGSGAGGSTRTPSSGGGAKGGSEPVRTPAAFTIKDGKLVPPGVTVPPFVAIELTVISDGAAHKVVFATPPSTHTLTVGPHGRAALRLAGLRAGSYGITLDGRVAGGIVVGGDGGP